MSNINKVCALLELEEETRVLELLEITSEELVLHFKERVRDKLVYLINYYEENNQEKNSFCRQSEATGLSSKEVWENAGYELEREGYE